jgi:acetyltransferase
MLEALFYPGAVAVIGASRSPGKVGHEVVANLVNFGYKGKIVPINPSAADVLGIKCYASLAEYGSGIDLSVISVPTRFVKQAVQESIAAGAKAIVAITAGFKETGADGAAMEKELAAICRQAGVRLMGPNCLGLINTDNMMNASFAKQMPRPGGISVISQSGALCTAILDWAAERHIGLAKLVSIGNKAELNETDFLQALAQDPQTKVIVAYLESITVGDEFLKAAELAASLKPVVILKSGTTKAGAKAASSHTGSLAGGDTAYGAAFKRCGVIRADGFEELFDYATALLMQPVPKGNRLAIITNAGGPGIMAADAAEEAGFAVGSLTPAIADELKKQLPSSASTANPLDVLGDADADRYALAVKAALGDPTVESIIVLLTPQAMTFPKQVALAIAELAKDAPKPVLVSFLGGTEVRPGREELVAHNLPDFPSPERAVDALRAMMEYAAWKQRPPRKVTRFPVNRRRVERIIGRQIRSGRYEIGEIAAKEILRAYGFTTAEGSLARTVEEAVEVAERVKYPVAMKIVSPDILHKSDVGGVRLNLHNGDAVRDAFELMMMRVKRRHPNVPVEGVYIEQMCPKGRETILGLTRDPQFGPMLMFGLGGIFVEVLKDITFHLAPITAEEAMQMLKETRSYALLEGVRGESSVDLAAIADGLQRISQLATDFPRIVELDINPFFVGKVGQPAFVADARMTLKKD